MPPQLAAHLKRAFESEIKVKQDIYPELVRLAFQLGWEDVAWSFIRARDVEKRHTTLYKDALDALVNKRELALLGLHHLRLCL